MKNEIISLLKKMNFVTNAHDLISNNKLFEAGYLLSDLFNLMKKEMEQLEKKDNELAEKEGSNYDRLKERDTGSVGCCNICGEYLDECICEEEEDEPSDAKIESLESRISWLEKDMELCEERRIGVQRELIYVVDKHSRLKAAVAEILRLDHVFKSSVPTILEVMREAGESIEDMDKYCPGTPLPRIPEKAPDSTSDLPY